jgi:hypothetical protein
MDRTCVQAVNWSLFVERFKRSVKKEKEVLNRLEMLPDELWDEISAFLGSSFEDELTKVRKSFSPFFNPFLNMQYPYLFYNYHEHFSANTHELVKVEWIHNEHSVSVDISYAYSSHIRKNIYKVTHVELSVQTTLELVVNQKRVFKGPVNTFKKSFPSYYNYMVFQDNARAHNNFVLNFGDRRTQRVCDILSHEKIPLKSLKYAIQKPFTCYDYHITYNASNYTTCIGWNTRTDRVQVKMVQEEDVDVEHRHVVSWKYLVKFDLSLNGESVFSYDGYGQLEWAFKKEYPQYHAQIFN